jgi:hypothetical protein
MSQQQNARSNLSKPKETRTWPYPQSIFDGIEESCKLREALSSFSLFLGKGNKQPVQDKKDTWTKPLPIPLAL